MDLALNFRDPPLQKFKFFSYVIDAFLLLFQKGFSWYTVPFVGSSRGRNQGAWCRRWVFGTGMLYFGCFLDMKSSYFWLSFVNLSFCFPLLQKNVFTPPYLEAYLNSIILMLGHCVDERLRLGVIIWYETCILFKIPIFQLQSLLVMCSYGKRTFDL